MNTENNGYIRGLYTAKGMLRAADNLHLALECVINAIDQAEFIKQDSEEDYLLEVKK